LKKGLVIKSTGSWYSVHSDDGIICFCKIRGKLRMSDIRSTNPIAVGDYVRFEPSENEDTGMIIDIYERTNYIIRKSPNLSKESHIIAANIDQACLIVTVKNPVTTTTFIDRFLVSAEAYRIPVKIIFNKIDLYNEADFALLEETIAIYSKIGYECFKVSAAKEINIEVIRELLINKVSVLSGHSGVGKSTFINLLDPGMKAKTANISESHHRGKHTTAHSEMYELKSGGYIIDTPGIKGFGVIDMEKEEISHYFPEIFKTATKCQYYNCTHTHEPSCAVKQAVVNGEISESRYISYISLIDGENNKYRKST